MAYYKNLIAIHEQNDPREILRMINPRETEMMDAAAGGVYHHELESLYDCVENRHVHKQICFKVWDVSFSGLHLRFRLGGERFPPRLLYKIFTHRPVTDICSFCPRNYNTQKLLQSQVGHATTQAPIFSTTHIGWNLPGGASAPTGWYNREENNQWRPIDGKVFESGFFFSERKPYKPVFHFCSRERARQRELHRKQLQRHWRLAMYRYANSELKKHRSLKFCYASNMQLRCSDGAMQDQGLGEEQAGVEEDLMEWCGALDFETYAQDWRSVATTLGSEAFVPRAEEPLPIAPPWTSTVY